jgi:hypothetical protein
MAALQWTQNIPSTSMNVTGGITIFAVKAPTNQRVKVLGYGFYFDGISNSAQPVQIKIGRLTLFTGSYTTTAPNPEEPEITLTIQASTYVANTNAATAEPSYSTMLKTITVHPQLGYEYLAPLGQEDIVGGAGYIGFQVAAPATVNIRGYVKCEE